jgi:hypothetical protein
VETRESIGHADRHRKSVAERTARHLASWDIRLAEAAEPAAIVEIAADFVVPDPPQLPEAGVERHHAMPLGENEEVTIGGRWIVPVVVHHPAVQRRSDLNERQGAAEVGGSAVVGQVDDVTTENAGVEHVGERVVRGGVGKEPSRPRVSRSDCGRSWPLHVGAGCPAAACGGGVSGFGRVSVLLGDDRHSRCCHRFSLPCHDDFLSRRRR